MSTSSGLLIACLTVAMIETSVGSGWGNWGIPDMFWGNGGNTEPARIPTQNPNLRSQIPGRQREATMKNIPTSGAPFQTYLKASPAVPFQSKPYQKNTLGTRSNNKNNARWVTNQVIDEDESQNIVGSVPSQETYEHNSPEYDEHLVPETRQKIEYEDNSPEYVEHLVPEARQKIEYEDNSPEYVEHLVPEARQEIEYVDKPLVTKHKMEYKDNSPLVTKHKMEYKDNSPLVTKHKMEYKDNSPLVTEHVMQFKPLVQKRVQEKDDKYIFRQLDKTNPSQVHPEEALPTNGSPWIPFLQSVSQMLKKTDPSQNTFVAKVVGSMSPETRATVTNALEGLKLLLQSSGKIDIPTKGEENNQLGSVEPQNQEFSPYDDDAQTNDTGEDLEKLIKEAESKMKATSAQAAAAKPRTVLSRHQSRRNNRV